MAAGTRCRRRQMPGVGGFTLLELLLALTIMAVLLTLVFSGFQLVVRAWEKGDRLVDEQQRMRVVPELLRRQLASLAIPEVVVDNQSLPLLRGESDALRFFSHVSLYGEGGGGTVLVDYRVREERGEGMSCGYFEVGINPLQMAASDAVDDRSLVDILQKYSSITFSYLAPPELPGDEGEWLPEWDSVERQGLPRAIGLTLAADRLAAPLRLVVPVIVRPESDRR